MTWILIALGLYLAIVAIKVAWRRHKSKMFVHNALKPGAGLER